MRIDLYPHQIQALGEMHNGCVLRGGVGSGKSITALTYFYTRVLGASITINGKGEDGPIQHPDIRTLLILTPAKKRESMEWEHECSRFGMSTVVEDSIGRIEVIIDSWNNIGKYADISNAFVIFDEQRLVGAGAWVKAFYKIAAANPWVLLSATPGDTWMDFIPIFVANGFYKNRTAFIDRHVVYSKYTKFPKVDRFVETGLLAKFRNRVLVEMPFHRHTTRHVRTIPTQYDELKYRRILKERWNEWLDEPVKNIAGLILLLRRVANEDQSRLDHLYDLWEKHKRLIVYYSFTYELDQMRSFITSKGVTFAEWNGQKHQEIPDTDSWIYLVQYTAGSDAWNCTTTDAMVFMSLQYSYKTFEQCQGRIDRLNTPYEDLYYYVLRSKAPIELAIWKALVTKKTFSEKKYSKEQGYHDEDFERAAA